MASVIFEVECECEGVVIPVEPDIGAGRAVDAADLSSVSMLVATRKNGTLRTWWRPVDLLEGLDAAARKIVIANIMDAFGDEIDAAILEDAE